MARPPRVEFPGALYHVIVRGNERKAVFRDDADRELYLRRGPITASDTSSA
jgi:putative transposase